MSRTGSVQQPLLPKVAFHPGMQTTRGHLGRRVAGRGIAPLIETPEERCLAPMHGPRQAMGP